MDREAIAWAAGFFDGEGCTSSDGQKLRKDGSIYRNPRITITQANNPEVLDKFQKIFGLGRVYKRKNNIYTYQARGFEKTQAIIAMMWEFLGSPKREQATKILQGYIAHAREHRKPGRKRI